MSNFADKNVLITGATGVLGQALVREYCEQGANVGVHHRGSPSSTAAAQELIAWCTARGRQAHSVEFDLRDTAALSAQLENYITRVSRVDVLLCNAGVFRTELLATATQEAIDETIAVNLLAPLHCVRVLLPHMLRAKSGVIAMVGSVAAVRPFRAQVAYSASKAGLEGLVRSLAVEYARKRIRTFGVRVGPMASPMSAGVLALDSAQVRDKTLQSRLLTAQEVARTIAELSHERNASICGTMVDLDAGYVLA
jgi:3-oxoacyl-[acyl-carrier protein] reductase